jgi:YD repeat-containing protein
VIGNNVYVGYSNGVAKDGTGVPPNNFSTIAEYNRSGQLLHTTTVEGHTDGLRYNAATNQIWATQNEDGKSNLVLITPGTLAKSAVIPLSSVNGGGGFDDILFHGGVTYLSASNPQNNPNSDPAIVAATLSGGIVTTTPVLLGNASAKPLNSTAPSTLNLTDPDSLSQTVDGRVVLTSQGDSQLVFIGNINTPGQTVAVLDAKAMVDDTSFGGVKGETLLVADKQTNVIYRISGDFNPNYGYSSAQDNNGLTGFIAAFDATNNKTIGKGFLGDIVTGLGNPGGSAFQAGVPEPSTWAMMLFGFAGLGFAGWRRAKSSASASA